MLIYSPKFHPKELRVKSLYIDYKYREFVVPTANERTLAIYITAICKNSKNISSKNVVWVTVFKTFVVHLLDPYTPIRSIDLPINIRQAKKDIVYTMSYILNKVSRNFVIDLEDTHRMYSLILHKNYIGGEDLYPYPTISYGFCMSSKSHIPILSNIYVYANDRCPKKSSKPKYCNRRCIKYMDAYYRTGLINTIDLEKVALENMITKIRMKPIYLRQ